MGTQFLHVPVLSWNRWGEGRRLVDKPVWATAAPERAVLEPETVLPVEGVFRGACEPRSSSALSPNAGETRSYIGAAVRDTEDRGLGCFTVGRQQWQAFLDAVRTGRFE
ncbi:hypothetical protein FHR84_000844 [Actinopolyspora biskrensis]|uniref:DUF397 domain-containing protein n=1 Tax=Actinopolyspora biskrensis TaxID=1470178 RepID=A0A852YTW7_9ACTN|nr:hypothetical protein [Actinopolyspora biskrensis]